MLLNEARPTQEILDYDSWLNQSSCIVIKHLKTLQICKVLQNTDSNVGKISGPVGIKKRYGILSHKLKHLLECVLYWVVQGNSLYLKPYYLICKHSDCSCNQHAVTQFLCVRKCAKWLAIQRLENKTFPFPQKKKKIKVKSKHAKQ